MDFLISLFFLALVLFAVSFFLKLFLNKSNDNPTDVIDSEMLFMLDDMKKLSEEPEAPKQYADLLTNEPLGQETRFIEVPTADGKVRAEVNKETAARFAKYGLKAFPDFKARLKEGPNSNYAGKYYLVSEPNSYNLIDFIWDYFFFTQILGLFNDSTLDYVPLEDPRYCGYVDPDYHDPEMELTDTDSAEDMPEDVFVASESESSATGEPTKLGVEEPDVEDLDQSTIDIAVDSVAEEASESFDSEDTSDD